MVCPHRRILISLCALQLITCIGRLVFDFLGYMWAPILSGCLQVLFVIIGLIGTIQYRPKVLIVYTVWTLLWLAWNAFVICFYLEVGILSRDGSILNMGTGNKSWWMENGIGCTVNSSEVQNENVPSMNSVEGCLIEYYYVETIQAGIQCLLAVIGFFVSIYVINFFFGDDDSSKPVSDELEYIKMRYKSPAQATFRDNRPYKTLPTNSTTSTVDRGINGPHCSDDSLGSSSNRTYQSHKKALNTPPPSYDRKYSPQQTYDMTHLPEDQSLEILYPPRGHTDIR